MSFEYKSFAQPNQYEDKEPPIQAAYKSVTRGGTFYTDEALQQLITQKQLEARIDEVKKLNSLNSVYNMALSSRHKIYNYINDRIAELTTQKDKNNE